MAQIEKCNEVYIPEVRHTCVNAAASIFHIKGPWASLIRGLATFSCGGKTECGAFGAAVTLVFYHGSGAVAPRPALAWI